ncbi:MAG: hypothetical protein HYX42_04125 [Polaromonas sp.]|uniref:hypothetical protein n=1 Tax=Polaromonas sp. TaxID=1869339 RepID=UPI0025D7925C|nr:hypothetical protein [Polaromonas sp.]MBI2725417.1 hypothetical protein [Polaromonas sp.]
MSSTLSAFNWRGQPSQFATDPKFASKQQGSAGMPKPIHRFAQTNLNTETISPADKTRLIRGKL